MKISPVHPVFADKTKAHQGEQVKLYPEGLSLGRINPCFIACELSKESDNKKEQQAIDAEKQAREVITEITELCKQNEGLKIALILPGSEEMLKQENIDKLVSDSSIAKHKIDDIYSRIYQEVNSNKALKNRASILPITQATIGGNKSVESVMQESKRIANHIGQQYLVIGLQNQYNLQNQDKFGKYFINEREGAALPNSGSMKDMNEYLCVMSKQGFDEGENIGFNEKGNIETNQQYSHLVDGYVQGKELIDQQNMPVWKRMFTSVMSFIPWISSSENKKNKSEDGKRHEFVEGDLQGDGSSESGDDDTLDMESISSNSSNDESLGFIVNNPSLNINSEEDITSVSTLDSEPSSDTASTSSNSEEDEMVIGDEKAEGKHSYGRINPFRVDYKDENGKDIEAKAQADKIMAEINELVEKGRKVAITYSANDKQATGIYIDYKENSNKPSYAIDGSGQAPVFKIVQQKISEDNNLRKMVHILPITTTFYNPGNENNHQKQAELVKKDVENIARHCGEGYTILGLQNQDNFKEVSKKDKEEYGLYGKYAIGGGVNPNWRKEGELGRLVDKALDIMSNKDQEFRDMSNLIYNEYKFSFDLDKAYKEKEVVKNSKTPEENINPPSVTLTFSAGASSVTKANSAEPPKKTVNIRLYKNIEPKKNIVVELQSGKEISEIIVPPPTEEPKLEPEEPFTKTTPTHIPTPQPSPQPVPPESSYTDNPNFNNDNLLRAISYRVQKIAQKEKTNELLGSATTPKSLSEGVLSSANETFKKHLDKYTKKNNDDQYKRDWQKQNALDSRDRKYQNQDDYVEMCNTFSAAYDEVKEIKSEFSTDDEGSKITFSADDPTDKELLRIAETASIAANQTGKTRFVIKDDDNVELADAIKLFAMAEKLALKPEFETSLQQKIQKDFGSLNINQLQPKINWEIQFDTKYQKTHSEPLLSQPDHSF